MDDCSILHLFRLAKVTAVTALPRSLASPAAAPPERAERMDRVDRGRKQMPVPDVTLGCQMWVWYLKNPGNKKTPKSRSLEFYEMYFGQSIARFSLLETV